MNLTNDKLLQLLPTESAGDVVVTTSAYHAGRTGSIPGTGSCDIKSGSQHWGLCIPRESENHVNVGPISIWDVKEPLRMTSTLAVTILSDSCMG